MNKDLEQSNRMLEENYEKVKIRANKTRPLWNVYRDLAEQRINAGREGRSQDLPGIVAALEANAEERQESTGIPFLKEDYRPLTYTPPLRRT
jgi:hypothetical protein